MPAIKNNGDMLEGSARVSWKKIEQPEPFGV